MSSKQADTWEFPYNSTMWEDILKEILEKTYLQIDVTSTSPTSYEQVPLVELNTPNTWDSFKKKG